MMFRRKIWGDGKRCHLKTFFCSHSHLPELHFPCTCALIVPFAAAINPCLNVCKHILAAQLNAKKIPDVFENVTTKHPQRSPVHT